MSESDDTGERGVSVTNVSVNGVDVGALAGTPTVRVGMLDDKRVTVVTLKLITSRLEIRGDLADGERRAARAGFTAKID
ncbi:hypothetical protein [Streptomyces sp. NPDC006638]|uniref:hypothetical protein n=1 Tax=Streptomyces sp. NPDC006638 TaxID=3157183 RepID=UPI0033AB3F54